MNLLWIICKHIFIIYEFCIFPINDFISFRHLILLVTTKNSLFQVFEHKSILTLFSAHFYSLCLQSSLTACSCQPRFSSIFGRPENCNFKNWHSRCHLFLLGWIVLYYSRKQLTILNNLEEAVLCRTALMVNTLGVCHPSKPKKQLLISGHHPAVLSSEMTTVHYQVFNLFSLVTDTVLRTIRRAVNFRLLFEK